VSTAQPGSPSGATPGTDPGIVVAVDGPSGSGKSSTSRGVARRLGMAYLDTGAMYRAMTWWMLQQGIEVHDVDTVAARAGEPRIVSGTDPAAPTISVDGVDVAAAIRTEQVTRAVSPVSAVPDVRARLLELQRATIAEATSGSAAGPGIVVEGRDIGSTVVPHAPVKVYLTADAEARALRRAAEEGGSDVAVTQAILEARDRIDSGRAASPLTMAEGAVHVDTTPYTLDQVVDRVVALVEAVSRRGEAEA
jgi:cytidylate kinase